MQSTEKKANEIDTNDFLKFLRISYQLKNMDNISDGMQQYKIDYNDLANDELINRFLIQEVKDDNSDALNTLEDITKSIAKTNEYINTKKSNNLGCKKKTKSIDNDSNIHPVLKNKLDEFLNENILEYILPYICKDDEKLPKEMKRSSNKSRKSPKGDNVNSSDVVIDYHKTEKNLNELTCSQTVCKKSTQKLKEYSNSKGKTISEESTNNKISDIEVTIHVCDEIKGVTKNFTCLKSLLIDKMEYFADVTSDQRLEEMEISVHCDIQIFEWLMSWVKKSNENSRNMPRLNTSNVIPILVSASFLKMEPLILDCLTFCHSNLNEIIKSSTNLSCLNDPIITRLAAMFTNFELEMVDDKKKRIAPKLWTKLIQSLLEPDPEALRGHYFTVGGLYKCLKCNKLVTQSASLYIRCTAQNTTMNRWGQVLGQHSRDSTWNMQLYIEKLYEYYKSWRKVYWRLWGHCHYLYCTACEIYFPAYEMKWCRYHSEQMQYLVSEIDGSDTGSVGRHPCCGKQSFRFETLPVSNGCKFREHIVLVENDRDRSILSLAQVAGEAGCLYEEPPKNISSYSQDETFFPCILLKSSNRRQGLLPMLHLDGVKQLYKNERVTSYEESSSESESISSFSTKNSSSFTTDEQVSVTGCIPKNPNRFSKKLECTTSRSYWSGEMSARTNQDNQREYEEKMMKNIAKMLGKPTGIETNDYPRGGIYVRLEAEWNEAIKKKLAVKQKSK